MSMELLRLTSASLPSSATPHINKPVVPNVGTLNSSIFSPLPQSTDDNCGSWDQKMTENQRPTSSPITIKARDASIDLFSASAQSSLVSSPSRDSRSIQSSLLTCTNTSTPGSVRVKISPNKLMEIPSPIPNKTKSSDGTAVQTPPRALGIPTNRPDKESGGGFQEKPSTIGNLVKRALPQGVIRTGSATTLDESNTDDSIIAVSQNGSTNCLLVKQRLVQQKQSNPKKQCITVHPSVMQQVMSQRAEPSLVTDTKSVQTKYESVDEGTQCVEKKFPLKTRGVQTSPCDLGHPMKRHPEQSLTSQVTGSRPLPTTVMTSQFATDTVTLIASTAAAAAVAASTSLHGNNNNHTKAKESCLNLQTHFKSASANTYVAPPIASHNATTQTDRNVREDKITVTGQEITSPCTVLAPTDVTVKPKVIT